MTYVAKPATDNLPTFDLVRVLRQSMIAFFFVALLASYNAANPAASQSNASGTNTSRTQAFESQP